MQNSTEYKKWIKKYAINNWYLIAILGIITIIGVAIELLIPIPLQLLIDNVLTESTASVLLLDIFGSDQFALATILIGFYLLINVLGLVFNYFQALIQVKFNQRIDRTAMAELFDDSMRIPYNDPLRSDPNDNLYAITIQSQEMSIFILSNSINILQAVLTLVGAIIILVTISIPVVLFIIVALPFLVVSIRYFNKVIEKKAGITEESHSLIYSFISESLTKLRTIQAFAYGPKRLVKLNSLVDTRNKNALSQLKTTQHYDVTTQGIFIITTAAALIAGSFAVINNVLTIGVLVLVLYYLNLAFGQIAGLVETAGAMSSQRAALQQAFAPVERAGAFPPGGSIDPIKGRIEFRNVNITKGGVPILSDVNLTIPSGSTVGIIGPSGSGKTTLIDSILRFSIPQSGYITIDDKNIKDYNLDHLRQNIALVEQEPDLFDEGIKENIALADPERKSDLIDVVAASQAAGISEFVEQRNESHNNLIDNSKLSGGQKQRIAIARAFYKDSPILLMDEPTSALDGTLAHNIIDAVMKLSENRTTLIITHDIELLKKIPNIFVVKDGSVRPVNDYGGLEAYSQTFSSLQ